MTKRVYLDFESRSEADIWDVGAWNYSCHPSTEILCLVYAIDNGPVCVLRMGKQLSEGVRILNALVKEGAEFHAHNAFFERSIWLNKLIPYYGAVPIGIKQWRCTAAKAMANALPKSLENVAKALGCKHQKDMSGHKMMLILARSKGPIPEDKLERLCLYCGIDVETEREIDQKLPDLDEKEQKIWFLDQYMNDMGVCVDLDAVHRAVEIIESETGILTEELQLLTNGEVNAGTQRDAIKSFLEKKGLNLPDLKKKTIVDALTNDQTGLTRRILELRQKLSLTSNAKYNSLIDATSHDGRIRDLQVYHGASTGRWAGKLVQVQNLPKPPDLSVDYTVAISVLKTDKAAFRMLYDDVLGTLSGCIRGMFVPSPSCDMFTTDFSAIEARVVLWLAGEEKGLELFRVQDTDPSKPDIYVHMARQIYGNETITKKNKPQRQLGKQATLGCIAEGSMVYSDKGYIPIETLNQGQRIWNGEQWVSFRELVPVGKKSVIQIEGLWLTPDHRILTRQGWQTAGEIAISGDTQCLNLGRVSGDGQLRAMSFISVLNAVSLSAVNAALRKIEGSINYGGELQRLVDDVLKVSKGSLEGGPVNTLISCLIHAYERNGVSAGTIFAEGVSTKIIPTIDGMALVAFEYPSNHVEHSWNTLLRLMGGGLGDSRWIELIMPKGTSQEIFALLHKESTIATRISECYDLLDVEGQRFQCENMVVHNCGFGMGHVKFKATCETYGIIIDDALAQRAVNGYRQTFPKVKAFWYDMETAAKRCVLTGKSQQVGHILWFMDGEFLRMKLPRGRNLAYHRPRVMEDQLSFMGTNPVTKRYVPETTWGGTLVENATQAVARDIMVEAMMQMVMSGSNILFTVHDELVTEAPKGNVTVEDILKIVRTVPSWAAGCPINAECEKVERYKK